MTQPPPLPSMARYLAMPWPTRQRLAAAYRTTQGHLESLIRARDEEHVKQVRLGYLRQTAGMVNQLVYTCSGCGMPRHLGYTCRTCALFTQKEPPP